MHPDLPFFLLKETPSASKNQGTREVVSAEERVGNDTGVKRHFTVELSGTPSRV